MVRGPDVHPGFARVFVLGMDRASRHVLSWRLSNTMDSRLCIEALEAVIGYGTPQIFNTDQGVQFTSAAFTERVSGVRGRSVRWTAAGGAWTTCSSNGCGGR